MKFTCDSCSAQYMISDEKVGPSGVKVRCKKCGNVVLVRRAAELAAAVAAVPAAAAAAGGSAGLDVELGQAFDTAFGDQPAQGAPAGDADLAKTQLMGSEDEARIAAPAPSPAPTEWYVAIGQAQVGPLPLAEVKRKWEAGDVGPDSLVWRPGMADWLPLSSVAELAGYLAPVPRAPSQAAQGEASPQPAREKPAATPAPADDVIWKPIGASALASLASEEIATRHAPEPKLAASRGPGAPSGVKSLVDGLPDGGGVDPTGSIPISIKGLDTTGEKKIERIERRSSVASRAEQTRHKRSVARAVVIGVVIVIAAVGGAAAYVLSQMEKLGVGPPVATSSAPVPAREAPPAPPPAAAPAPGAVAASGAAPAAAAPPVPAKPDAAAGPAEPPAPAAAAPAPQPEKAAPSAEPARRTGKPEQTRVARKETLRREAPVARAEAPPPPAEAPPPAAARPAPSKRNSLLDFDSSDAALDDALGSRSGSTGRSVYVPPARAGAGALPAQLSPAQINESVAGRIDALRKCVSEQKARDPAASGVLKLRWVIGGDGNVRDVKTLTSEFASSPFAQCITGVVRGIKFPRSATAGQEVTFPFSF
jgi:predicted Zn finger-like uncharacterized protein